MTTYELRATARELAHLHHRFAPLFGRKEAQTQIAGLPQWPAFGFGTQECRADGFDFWSTGRRGHQPKPGLGFATISDLLALVGAGRAPRNPKRVCATVDALDGELVHRYGRCHRRIGLREKRQRKRRCQAAVLRPRGQEGELSGSMCGACATLLRTWRRRHGTSCNCVQAPKGPWSLLSRACGCGRCVIASLERRAGSSCGAPWSRTVR